MAPRTGSIAADIVDFLQDQPRGATIEEITAGLQRVRRAEVRRESVRSALYQHEDDNGHRLFTRVERGRFKLRRR